MKNGRPVIPNPRILGSQVRLTHKILIRKGAYEFFMPAIEARLRILPRVMIHSGPLQGIMARLRLPEDITKEQVDINEPLVLYPPEIAASHQYLLEFPPWQPELVVVVAIFDKLELMDALSDNGRVELQVVGKLKYGQELFGKDNVWIISRDIRCLVGFALHWLIRIAVGLNGVKASI